MIAKASRVFQAGRCTAVAMAESYQHTANSAAASFLVSNRGRNPKWPAQVSAVRTLKLRGKRLWRSQKNSDFVIPRSPCSEKLPALKTGGHYKINPTNAHRFCRGLSVPCSSGRRGHVPLEI